MQRLKGCSRAKNAKTTATIVNIKPCTVNVVLIDVIQNGVLISTQEINYVDHAHALTFDKWIHCVGTLDVTFTTHPPHRVYCN